MSTLPQTLAIIKPTAVTQGHIGGIIDSIEKGGFQIKALKMTRLSLEEGKAFYKVHADKPFYEELYTYISSGNVVAMVLAKEHAVQDFRTLIGATNPMEAAPGTIRKAFGITISENAIHGSDSLENAKKEQAFFFPEKPQW